MHFTLYEVGFGESILYYEYRKRKCERLLVDCGSKKGAKYASREVINDLKTQNDSLLITHFDIDHYNGILLIPSLYSGFRFKKVYLPRYVYSSNSGTIENTETFFRDTIKYYAFLKLTGSKKRLNQLQKLMLTIPKLVNGFADIITVGYPYSFNIGSKEAEVVWPDASFTGSLFIPLLSASSLNSRRKNVITTLITQYEEAFMALYEFLSRPQYARNAQEEYENIVERLMNADGNLERYSSRYKGIKIPGMRSIHANKIKSMNECSVVFKVVDELLALGDVSSRIISDLVDQSRLDETYDIVKIQHHGTEDYYCTCLPTARRYKVISNNFRINSDNPARWDKWKIFSEYYDAIRCVCTNKEMNNCQACVANPGLRRCDHCNLVFCNDSITI